MKRMIVSAAMLMAMATTYATGTSLMQSAVVVAAPEDNKTAIDPAALPEAVKKTLAGDAYKGWEVTAAWTVKANPDYYSVELKKDDKTNTVNLDKDGKVK